MDRLQVLDGHMSVYEILSRFGLVPPGKHWKRLLKTHADQLPETRNMQFLMGDGRKGRLTPAVQVQDYDRLVLLLDNLNLEPEDVVFHLPAEEEALQVIVASFADLNFENQRMEQGYSIDLYLPEHKIAIQCLRSAQHPERLQTEMELQRKIAETLGCTFVNLNPHEKGFNVGKVIFDVRRTLAKSFLSHPQTAHSPS